MEENTTVQAIKLKKEKVIKGITCPSCGGELDLKEGMKVFNCKFCGTLLIAGGESGTLKYYVPKSIKREDAITRAFNWLGQGISKAKGLKSSSKTDEAFLTFIPYWRVRADVVGWVFGQEKRTSNNSTTYVDKEIKIQNSFDRNYAACDISELGVRKVNLEGDSLYPVEVETLQQEGMMFNIVSSEKDIYEKSLNDFKEEARNTAKLDRVTFEHYDLVRQNVSVVYYPLWVVRYVYQNRTYQVVVDGQDGSICYGKAPGNNLFRAVAGILGTGVGMFLVTFFEIFGIISSKNSAKFAIAVYIIFLIIGIFIIKWAYKKFRYGGEIEQGTGLVEEKKESMIKKSGLSFISKPGAKSIGTFAAGAVIGSILDND